jgi:mediator of RNA polymerase II transcription subunit 18
MDITTAFRGSMAPLQEYLLQGSILEAQRDILLHRLNGLCDNVDTGPEKFHDHEIVYSLSMFFSFVEVCMMLINL